jgi:hypothetical protein
MVYVAQHPQVVLVVVDPIRDLPGRERAWVLGRAVLLLERWQDALVELVRINGTRERPFDHVVVRLELHGAVLVKRQVGASRRVFQDVVRDATDATAILVDQFLVHGVVRSACLTGLVRWVERVLFELPAELVKGRGSWGRLDARCGRGRRRTSKPRFLLACGAFEGLECLAEGC